MTTQQKINRLEVWDANLADAMLAERDQWLDAAMSVCIRSSRTRREAVKHLAEAMENYLQDSIDRLCRTTPAHILNAMDGFCQIDPSICFECIADALIDDYWPEGSSKPVTLGTSSNRRPTAGRPGPSATRTRKAPTKKAPARKPARRY